MAEYPRGARLARRAIDDFEFVWMLRGEASFVTDDQERRLLPGRLLLVPPVLRHAFVWDQGRTSRHGYIHFRPEDVGAPAADPSVRLRAMTEHDPLASLCSYLIWLGRERPEGWMDRSVRSLEVLFSVFASGPLPDEVDAVLPVPLSAAVVHLRREWSEMPLRRIDVAELADAAHVSRSYLNRLFRASFGISVASGLERLRCRRARDAARTHRHGDRFDRRGLRVRRSVPLLPPVHATPRCPAERLPERAIGRRVGARSSGDAAARERPVALGFVWYERSFPEVASATSG